jgi:hypothetical protein
MINRTLKLTLLAGAALALGSIAGCGESDDAQAAMKQAERAFTSISVGDANATPSFSEQSYKDTEQALAGFAGDEDGYAEAAALGVAMAKKGQAALASQRASRVESDARQQARVIRGMINEWLTMDAIAQAAGKFDPAPEIREILDIIELRRQDIASYQNQLDQIREEIEMHEAKIADLRAKADEQGNQAGALELQMPRVSAQEAAELAQQVREFTLRADQYLLEAVRIEGVVGQLGPGSREVALNVEKARSQIELLESAAQELRVRGQKSQEDAKQARTNASAAVERINAAVQEYISFRNTEARDASEEALTLIRGSISALRDARDTIKDIASLNKGDAQQMLAEITLRQASGFAEEAQLYLALKEAGLSGNWDRMIEDANQQSIELKEAAQQSYLDAAASLRGARIRGVTGDKLEATAQRLETLGGLTPEPEFDASQDETFDDSEMDNTSDEPMDPDMDSEEG